MKKKMTIVYVACIHLLLAVVLVESDFLSRAKKAFGPATGGQPEITEHFHRMVLYHSRMDGNVPDGAVVFIGDSITQGLCVSAVFPLSVNYGIGSDTTAGVLKRLATYPSIRRASAVVVAVGVNDMKFRSNKAILQNYAAIAARIPEKVPVVFSAVLPLNETKRGKQKSGYPGRIRALNAGLEAFCTKENRLFFLNVGPILADGAGDLAGEFDDGDGVHLNSKGNAIWIARLREKIAEACESTEYGKR